MNVREEDCYDASTDDEGGEPIGRSMLKAVVVKKEEDVDTDDELPATSDSGICGGRANKKFEERVQALKAYQAEHGHLNVTKSEDKSLYQFCVDIRYSWRNPERRSGMKPTRERIAALDAIGFDWEPQSKSKRDTFFQERVEDLKAYKAEHGHLNVTKREDKSLYQFCHHIRYSWRNPERRSGMKLIEDRVASLDALGFEWGAQNKKVDRFQERLEELKAYEAGHGHLDVKESEDSSLYRFCVSMRYCRKTPESKKGRRLTKGRIAALDALGFDWTPEAKAPPMHSKRSSNAFQKRLDELKAYKAKHGHLKVMNSEDRSLYHFCRHIKSARRGRGNLKLDDERIASLDALGFEWGPFDICEAVHEGSHSPNAFQKRLEKLKAYKAKHGHLNVTKSEDKSLAAFCYDIRRARKGHGSMNLTEARIAALDDLGFGWAPKRQQDGRSEPFEKRLEELKTYKAEHGHLNVKRSEDNSLAGFCYNIRQARGTGDKKRVKLTKESIASLDALGFDWKPQKEKRDDAFQERVAQLSAYKAKHGHLKVKKKCEDKSLSQFCASVRHARRHPKSTRSMKLDDDRIAALDALGFDWDPPTTRDTSRELRGDKGEGS